MFLMSLFNSNPTGVTFFSPALKCAMNNIESFLCLLNDVFDSLLLQTALLCLVLSPISAISFSSFLNSSSIIYSSSSVGFSNFLTVELTEVASPTITHNVLFSMFRSFFPWFLVLALLLHKKFHNFVRRVHDG